MTSTSADGIADRLEVGGWKHALGSVPADKWNHPSVELDEPLAKGLFQHDPGLISDHGEEVVAEHSICVQGPQALETAPGAFRDRWNEIGRRDRTLLELRGVLGAERPPGVETQRRESERPVVRGRQLSECSNVHCHSKIDRAQQAGGVAARCPHTIETYE